MRMRLNGCIPIRKVAYNSGMIYLILFLEGIITFISPCLLPMLPLYISYFAGGEGKSNAFKNALGFVLGFTIIFISLGAFAGGIGQLLIAYNTFINIITGSVVILFGLYFLGFFTLPYINLMQKVKVLGFKSAFLFGLVFAVGWTPCVSAFLGSALMMASQSASAVRGMGMLLVFSLGLGLPFIASAVLIEQFKGAFDGIKKYYRVINIFSGVFLIVVGILMITGWFGRFLFALSV